MTAVAISTGSRASRLGVLVVATSVLLEVVTGVAAAAVGRQSFATMIASFTATNLAIALGFGTSGALLAWHRPRHPVGWLLLGAGAAQGATGAAAPLMILAVDRGWPAWLQQAAATGFTWSWPWSMGLGLPLALLLFPDGRLPSRRWRPAATAVVVVGIAFVIMIGADPASSNVDGRVIPHWLSWPAYQSVGALWSVVALLNVACLLLVTTSLVVRHRRGDAVVRRQLLWLVLALVVVVLVAVPVTTLDAPSELMLLVFLLVPAAIVVAVLRHNLLDIRLVVSRAVAWTALSVVLSLAYVALASLLGGVVGGPVSIIVATALVTLVMNPVRLQLQRRVDRLFYGDRGDPLRVLGRVGTQMSGSDDLAALAADIADTLRLPFVCIRSGAVELAAVGQVPTDLHSVPLSYGAEAVGELVVGVRDGNRRLSRRDASVLQLLCVPVALAVRASILAEELREARTRVVSAREEERRRLRRDLHDGLGSALSAMAFKIDAARNYVLAQPDESLELLAQLRLETTTALADVRRLVYGLRPPVLDDRGLVEALRRQADRLQTTAAGRPLVVSVQGPEPMPELPAAAEVAAYRIATEALTNVVRHSAGCSAGVVIRVGAVLEVEVHDDGGPTTVASEPGVGLVGMHERASELGGWLTACPGPTGWRVRLGIPLAADVQDPPEHATALECTDPGGHLVPRIRNGTRVDRGAGSDSRS